MLGRIDTLSPKRSPKPQENHASTMVIAILDKLTHLSQLLVHTGELL